MKTHFLSIQSFFVLFILVAFTTTTVAQKIEKVPKNTSRSLTKTVDKIKDGIKSKYTYESIPNDPMKTRIYTLENGLKVYLSVNKEAPRIQTAIPVRVGCKQDPRETTGLAHYLEHMMFKGTDEIACTNWEEEQKLLQEITDLYEEHLNEKDPEKKKAIYKKIDSVSYEASKMVAPNEYDKMVTSLGAKGTNAYTSTDETVYINNIPANELEKWLKLESERFSQLVLRLFHTELETVYEEFNMSQDRDGSKVYETMLANIFPKHPYNISTIGLGEHLKNPSLVAINDFFDEYYVANNMAICLAGDLDYDKTIALIDKYFGNLRTGDVPKFTFEKEDPITAPIVKEVIGSEAESVSLYFRFDGAGSEQAKHLEMADMILKNGKAGLVDLNLVQQQKVLGATVYPMMLGDYSVHVLSGKPREGQTLDEVRDLLLGQIELLKKGEFDEWLMPAVIKDFKLSQIRGFENNRARTSYMVESFINNISWKDMVGHIDELEALTKEQIVDFANKHYGDNYVCIYKRQGKDKEAMKVEKPPITPVELDRSKESDFAAEFNNLESGRLEPMFLDYKRDIRTFRTLSDLDFNYIKNENNGLFNLYYILDMGTAHNKKLGSAIKYLPFLGTDKYTAEELKKEFYKLGLSFNVNSGGERSYVTLSGLDESFEEGIRLFEHLLANAQPDEKALQDMIAGELKAREDAKLNRNNIFWNGLYTYGIYGANSPTTNVLSNEELKALKADDLVALIKGLTSHEHYIFYYGSQEPYQVVKQVNTYHKHPKTLKAIPEPTKFVQQPTDKNKVYFVDYDMVQANILMLSREGQFDKDQIPMGRVFGEYFGSGLSSIVFQEIREKRALAYSAFAGYSSPNKPDKHHYVTAYMAVQADKMKDAIGAMNDLLTDMPKAEQQFASAKASLMKKIESERITKARKFFSYLSAKDRGLDYDLRRDTYRDADAVTLDQMNDFFQKNIKNDTHTILVIGKKSDLDMDFLKTLGAFEELTIDQLFNY